MFKRRKLEKELYEALDRWKDVDEYARFQQVEIENKNKEINKLKLEKIDDLIKINNLKKELNKKENELKDKLKNYEKKISDLEEKLFTSNKNNKKYIKNNRTIDDLKKKIVEKGGSIQSKYIDTILQYCIDNNNKIFTSKEFCKKCKIKSRQSGNYYLKKLIEWDIIEKVKKCVYKCKKM